MYGTRILINTSNLKIARQRNGADERNSVGTSLRMVGRCGQRARQNRHAYSRVRS